MKIINLEKFFVSAGAAAFIVCGSFPTLQNQMDFEAKYRSHFEIPHNQDLPGHSYIYEHPSTITMTISGSIAPLSEQQFSRLIPNSWEDNSIKVFKVE